MTTHFIARTFLFLACVIGFAQPSIDSGGIVNDASRAPQSLPNSAIAQGSIFRITGHNLGPAAPVAGTLPLQTDLAGTSLSVTVDTITISPLIVTASDQEITAIMPSKTPVGTGTISAMYKGQPGAAEPITVAKTTIGIYTVTDVNYVAIGAATSAMPGQELILWATGAGPVDFDETVPPASPVDLQSAIQARIYAGGQMVTPSFVGRAACCTGLDQINFQLPQSVSTGCSVPIAIQTGDVVSNFILIPIAAGGGVCTDSSGVSGDDPATPLKLGYLKISSVTTSPGGTGRIQIVTTDNAEARFAKSQDVFRSVPSGDCAVFPSTVVNPNDPIAGTPLDAGPSIGLAGANSFSIELPKAKSGFYNASVPGDPFGSPGEYVFTGRGGGDVGSFSVSVRTAPAIMWTNAGEVVNVHEAAGQMITWSGADLSGTVLITGTSGPGTQAAPASATFSCLVPAAAKSFLIPSAVLLSLPPTFAGGVPVGTLSVISQGSLQSFVIPGLDHAYGMAVQAINQNVVYVRQ
jgi:uncharacterized protein (TIGR03437 family)